MVTTRRRIMLLTVIPFTMFLAISIRLTFHREQQLGIPNNQSKYQLMKHILLWGSPHNYPFIYLRKGNRVFEEKRCEWTNCHITDDLTRVDNFTKFDAIVFHGPEIDELRSKEILPPERSSVQKYVFASIESPANYPICDDFWDGYFNWTWTFRLNSDAIWGYVLVRDATGRAVGPAINASWIKVDDMDPIDEEQKHKLRTKFKAVAWIVSNCRSSQRTRLVHQIRSHLVKHNFEVDIFGRCGTYNCTNVTACFKIIERDYFFYFAFENSLSEDYVTEKIVMPLNRNVIPVVYGGANYSRFLPDGIYLNAYKMLPEQVADQMMYIMKHPHIYYKYFRWQKYYKITTRNIDPAFDDYCNFCKTMNNEDLFKKKSVYTKFVEWWTGSGVCKRNELLYSQKEDLYDDYERLSWRSA